MAWGYGGYGRGGYSSPDPKDVDDNGVEALIKELKAAIDGDKLKDLKSVLAKLKLAINNNFPLYTREVANFGAYLYAIKNGKKKSADSILAAILKKNYSYDGFPLDILLHELNTADFKIIVNDVLNVSTQWNLEGVDLINEMFGMYPKETEAFVIAGRLNKFAAGENRVLTAKKVIEFGNGLACVAALNTFFGRDYIEKYTLNASKLADLVSAVDQRSDDIKKHVRTEYFYKIAVKAITFDMLEKDYSAGLIDDEALANYTLQMSNNYRSSLLVNLRNSNNEKLRVKIISSNSELLDFIAKNQPDLLPQALQDVFLF